MREAERIETERLLLRAPRLNDVQVIFDRYASDPDVTRYVGWLRHTSLADTRGFVELSNLQWERWKCGPMLAISRESGTLLGGTGLAFDTTDIAETGYVFARDTWGKGYATEALRAMSDLAARRSVGRLYAICHPRHQASWRVLEKCGFTRDETVKRGTIFPNLAPDPVDALSYSLLFGSDTT
jgi:RimJ/RimL family protein N-acetyltransferase